MKIDWSRHVTRAELEMAICDEAQMFVPDGRRPSPSDTFEELGLDELDVIELSVALERLFHVELPDEVSMHWTSMADVIESVVKVWSAA